MATPVGHAIVGALVARRLGMRSRRALVTAAIASCLPDADFLAGKALHGDFWSLHRGTTHSPAFGLALGMLGGLAGALGDGRQNGERDLIADAMTGSAIVASHAVVDRLWLPYLRTGRRSMPFARRARREAFNALLDATVYGLLAWRLWTAADAQ